MLLLLFLVYFGVNSSAAAPLDNENRESEIYTRKDNVHKVYNTYLTPLSKLSDHTTYFDEGENMLLIPNLDKLEASKNKVKSFKKPPKRMIQKIYKKNKSKSKKVYRRPVTSAPTQPSELYDNQEDLSNDTPTTETGHKKKKKWNNRRSRYPMPFHTLQSRRENYRRINKRDTNRSDVYILQDLDEIEFLSHENDTDAVEAHVKKYW